MPALCLICPVLVYRCLGGGGRRNERGCHPTRRLVFLFCKCGTIVQMENARAAAIRLVQKGRLDIMQKGNVLPPSMTTFKGPIRLRLRTPANGSSSPEGQGEARKDM